MKVTLELKETSQKLEFDSVKNTYTKGSLYCIYLDTESVQKFPLGNIWRVTETYH